MLAAGPERMVSTGRCRASPACTREPSPFTTMSGALSPRRDIIRSTAAIRSAIMGIRRAFSTVVRARRGASRRSLRSCEQVTGRSQCSRTSACARASWAALRTAKWAVTRERRYRVGVARDRLRDRRFVQGAQLGARGIVSARDEGDRISPERRPESGARQGLRTLSDQEQAHRRALPLDYRVGGEGGGDRHHRDPPRILRQHPARGGSRCRARGPRAWSAPWRLRAPPDRDGRAPRRCRCRRCRCRAGATREPRRAAAQRQAGEPGAGLRRRSPGAGAGRAARRGSRRSR